MGKNADKRALRKAGVVIPHAANNGKTYASATSAKRDQATQARRDERHLINHGVISKERFNNPVDRKPKTAILKTRKRFDVWDLK